jgi:hypothetical protein
MIKTTKRLRIFDRLHRLVRLPVPYIKWRKTAEENEALKRKLILTQFYATKAIGLLNSMVCGGEKHSSQSKKIVSDALDFCNPNANCEPQGSGKDDV